MRKILTRFGARKYKNFDLEVDHFFSFYKEFTNFISKIIAIVYSFAFWRPRWQEMAAQTITKFKKILYFSIEHGPMACSSVL